jgi:hypothetical protein
LKNHPPFCNTKWIFADASVDLVSCVCQDHLNELLTDTVPQSHPLTPMEHQPCFLESSESDESSGPTHRVFCSGGATAATVTVDPASPTKACTMLGQRVRCVWCNGPIVMEVVHRHHREPQAVEVCGGCGGDDSDDDGACPH